jgi:hypothetical protein
MMQRSGKAVGVVLAGVSTADVITVLGTGKPEAGRLRSAAQDSAGETGPLLIEVVSVAKPLH